jgi:hypothetical protein
LSQGTCGNPRCLKHSPDPICWDCTRELDATLDKIPALAELLAAAARTVRNGPDNGKGHFAPLPFDADILRFAGALHTLLVGCARDLMETRGVPFTPIEGGEWARGYVPTTADVALWLKRHLTDLRMLDSAGETFVGIVRGVEHGLALATGLLIPIYRGQCPASVGVDARGKPVLCDSSLYAPRGESLITCGRCKTTHDAAKLEQHHLADLGKALFGFAALQRALRDLGEPITDRTLSAWIKTGRLKPAGWERPDGTVTTHWIHRADRPMYRLADARRVRAHSTRVTPP